MLSDQELIELLRNRESDRVERKANASDANDIRQTICQFANDLPNHQQAGVLFIGVNDDGSCANLDITDEMLLRLSHMRDDGLIQPFPVMTVQRRAFEGCNIAVIQVAPSDMPPVRLRGRTWVRIGPRRAQATAEEERRLIERRRWGNLSFDQQSAAPASLVDLDLQLFQSEYVPAAIPADIREANDRPVEHQLRALRFLGRDGSPNNGAVLLFGTDPLTYFPGAYLQFVRYNGGAITDPVTSQHDLSGALPTVLRRLDEILSVNIAVAGDATGGPVEVRSPDYPLVALRQLAYNAVMHRSYEATNAPTRIYWFSNRVEILSPGGPYGQVNLNNFGEEGVTDYRNPLIAEAMNVLGYVQRFGMGIPLARKALADNGNPPLEFDVQPNAVLAVVRKTQ